MIAIAAHRKLLGDAPSLLDACSSAGLHLVQLIDQTPIEDTAVESESYELSERIHRMFTNPPPVGTVVGFDALPMSQKTLKWVEANSYYVEELSDDSRQQKRGQLAVRREELVESRTLPILQQDARDRDNIEEMREFVADVPGRSFDISSMFTAAYLMNKRDGRKALKNLEQATSKLQIVQDYAEINRKDPRFLDFAKNIYKRGTRYNLFIKYIGDPDNPIWHQLGTWNNGRCTIFTPSDELAVLALNDLLKAS